MKIGNVLILVSCTVIATVSADFIVRLGDRQEKRAGDSKGRERVELVTWRTRNPHAGCPSNGCWVVSGAPRMIEAYGINKAMWPHRCDGCSATNEIYDARWPRIEQEWRPVK